MGAHSIPEQQYDPEQNILHVSHPRPVHLGGDEAIASYFDAIVRFWRRSCGGRRAYYLVDWNGFTTDIGLNALYAQHVKRVVDECAVIIVRYTENPLQRAAARFVSLKLHVPSNTYATRDDALKVIGAHKAERGTG